jgi:alpha-methylacyl-CoA racemase
VSQFGMLHDVKVLDLSRLLPGPACSWFLCEMGADIVCVEPLKGTPARNLPPLIKREGRLEGSYFSALHAGKKSIAIDFRKPQGINIIRSLIADYDVLIEGFKPGTLEAMGLSVEQLHKINPNLIIARISGYGQTGPWSNRVGHDLNYLSVAGALAGVAHDELHGHAIYTLQISDLSGALTAAMGICAALFDRMKHHYEQKEYQGRVLDISLCESALALSAPIFAGLVNASPPRNPKVRGELLNGGIDAYRTYQCADGRWLSLGALEPKFLHNAMHILGPKPEHWAQKIATHTVEYWVKTLANACTAPVLAYTDLMHHEQHQSRKVIAEDQQGFSWIRAPFFNGELKKIPHLGEHTLELCYHIMNQEECQTLMIQNVIYAPQLST